MKNAIKLFGIIALVAVIGFSMVACGDDDDDGGGGGLVPAELQGRWLRDDTTSSQRYLVFNSVGWVCQYDSFEEAEQDIKSWRHNVTAATGNNIVWAHSDGVSTGSFTWSISGTTLTISASTSTLHELPEGTYTKQ